MNKWKGPWTSEVPTRRGAWIKNAEGDWVALALGDTDEMACAHANMITAFPDVAEALETVLNGLGALSNRNELLGWLSEEDTDRVFTALAKAQGE